MNLREPSSLGIQDVIQEIIEKSSQGDNIYRGESKCLPKISSTLYRQYEKEIDTEHFDIEIAQKEMLETVKEYTAFTDHTDILTELQHYGGKTNLIDFTTDYLIALFFACDSSYDSDGRLILLDKASRPDQIKTPKKNQNNRVISQKSVFVQSPSGYIEDNEVVIVSIHKELKQSAMDYLKKFHGITTETIYNDMMGYIQNQQKHKTAYTEFFIGITNFNKGCYQNAIAHYDETIRLNPSVISAYKNRGSAKAQLGRHEEAIADYNVAIDFYPRDALTYNMRGNSKFFLGWREEAIADFDEALNVNPELAEAYSNRGTAKAQLDRYEEAITDLDRAININPELAEAYVSRGATKAQHDRCEDAIADLDRAISIDPDIANAYLSRGAAKFILGRLEEAIADYDKVIRINPENVGAYQNRGKAKKSLHQYAAAEEDFKRAQSLAVEQELTELLQYINQELDDLNSHDLNPP